MPGDEQDKAGVAAPPPLIYLGALVFGLLLNRRFPVAFLPRGVARGLGWTLLGAGVLLLGWFERAMRQADTPAKPLQAGVAHCHGRTVSLHPQPRLPFDGDDRCGDRRPRERAVGHPPSAGRAPGNPTRRHRAGSATWRTSSARST